MSEFSLEQLLSELSREDTPLEIDFSAPEAGQFPPAITPGSYDFVFRLRKDAGVGGFDKVEIQGRKYLSVVFDLDVMTPAGETRTITYQRVNAYKHEKVAISSLGEFLRSLGLHRELGDHPEISDIVRTLQANDGRARGRGEAAWRFYDKLADVTWSTSPRNRKNKAGVRTKDTAWPRLADGSFAPTVTDRNGDKQYGQVEFIRYFSRGREEAASS